MRKLLSLISIVAIFAFVGCDIIKIKKKDQIKDNSSSVQAVTATPVVSPKLQAEPSEKELKLTEEVNTLHTEIATLNSLISQKNLEIVKLRGNVDELNIKIVDLNTSIDELKKMQQILYVVIIASVILNLILIVSLVRRKKVVAVKDKPIDRENIKSNFTKSSNDFVTKKVVEEKEPKSKPAVKKGAVKKPKKKPLPKKK